MKPSRLLFSACVALAAIFASAARCEETADEKLKKALAQKVSFEFVDTPFEDAILFFGSLTKVSLVIDPKTSKAKEKTPINLRVQDMALGRAVKWIAYLAETPMELKEGAVYFGADAKPATAAEPTKEELEEIEAIKKSLKRNVSFEFVDTPLLEGVDFLRHFANVSIIISPEIKEFPAINLKVHDMEMGTALKWILKLAELESEIRDGAVLIQKKANLEAAAEKQNPKK